MKRTARKGWHAFRPATPLTLPLALFIPFIMLLIVACSRPADIREVIRHHRNSFYYIDFANYPSGDASLPTGVFDSGTGGLSVLAELVNHPGLAGESFIYLGDLANMPYGSYSLENNTSLLIEHIIKDVQFLMGDKYYQTGSSARHMAGKSAVKAIVIACNTATAYGLDTVKMFLREAGSDIEVTGVIEAAAAGALASFAPGDHGSVAVMATDGTVSSGAYPATIIAMNRELNRELNRKAREELNSELNGRSNGELNSRPNGRSNGRSNGETNGEANGETNGEANGEGTIHIFQQAGVGIAEAIDESPDAIEREARTPRSSYRGPTERADGDMRIERSLWQVYDFDTAEGALLYDGTPQEPENIQINSVRNYIAFHVVTLMEKIRHTAGAPPLSSVILACTHYPFQVETFRQEFSRLRELKQGDEYPYRHLIAEELTFIDPARMVAVQLYDHLAGSGLLNRGATPVNEFYVSVPNLRNRDIKLRDDGSFTYEYKYGRQAGNIEEYVRVVPFSRTTIPDEIVSRLSQQIPHIYNMIATFNHRSEKTQFLNDQERIGVKQRSIVNE